MKNKIKEYLRTLGIEKCGIAHIGGKSAVVCLFPYYNGDARGNLSLYCRGLDYHNIVGEKLRLGAEFIKSLDPNAECSFSCDTGAPVDRRLAMLSGLGFYGDNNMLINDDFGSYFFIGYILCDIFIEADKPLEKECMHCGACRRACPGNALENGFDIDRCASHIGQKKGELSDSEIEILKKSGSIFGCDICQRVCPYNKIEKTAMEEFTHNIMPSLSLEDIETLSGREFLRKYKNRAFSWRGKKVLERNLKELH